MPPSMPVVWDERHRGHAPGAGIWLGVAVPGDEEPERGDALGAALRTAGCDLRPADDHGDGPLLRVHDADFVAYLEAAHRRWVEEGHLDDPGQPVVVPYVFALRQLTGGRPPRTPTAIRAVAGLYAIDTMTLISAGTYTAARAAVDGALTACDLVLAGAPVAYAAVRPPGHHVGRDFYGGSCYLNNAAVAAQYLRDQGVERVAIVDVDAHHGNGTQEIFYARGDVFYGSAHVDPAHGWFPHFVGFADERGVDAGVDANRNLPLAPGAGDREWLDAVSTLVDAARDWRADALVVSLGVDGAEGDPNSPFGVTADGYRAIGAALASLGRPTVLVQEGGYVLDTLGALVLATLRGWEDAPHRHGAHDAPPT
jgi:acetoin utilization deacetylase AcuC-like enzyme